MLNITPLRWMVKARCLLSSAAQAMAVALALAAPSFGQNDRPLGWDPYLTFAGNFDVGYHKTQFFENNHNVLVGQWDTRVEYWLYPHRDSFSWGPYVRATGI